MSSNSIIGAFLALAGAGMIWQGWRMQEAVAARLGDAAGNGPTEHTVFLFGSGALFGLLGLLLMLRR